MKKEVDYRIFVLIFFIIFLLLGIYLYKDYGVSWDEPTERGRGIRNFNQIFYGNEIFNIQPGDEHGPSFCIILYSLEKLQNLKDTRDIYLMRHLFTFLLFYISVFFFYLLCKEYFKNWKLGLLGATFLILSPRIFANAFYNSKDLGFLSMFIIGIYASFKWLEKPSYLRSFFLGLICALAIDLRIIGILIPFFTLVSFAYLIYTKKIKINEVLKYLILFLFSLILLILLFWPSLWSNPLMNFINFLGASSNYPVYDVTLFHGKYYSWSQVPWNYIFSWIMITTPALYLFLFLFGILFIVLGRFNTKFNQFTLNTNSIIILLWFFLPIFLVILLKSSLYDDWRHLYFIYPAFLIISLIGLVGIYNFLNNKKILKILLIVLVLLGLLSVSFWMIKNHPYENVYFNFLAGNPSYIQNSYSLDYWGLSYRQALEYILKNDNRSKINVWVDSLPGKNSLYILNESSRNRLNYVNITDSDYAITNYKTQKKKYSYPEVYSIKVDEVKIMRIYKVNSNAPLMAA